MASPSITMTEFAYQAARDLGCLRAGQTLSTDILDDILIAGNQMLDSWLIDELAIPASTPQVYDLVAGQQSYTIGPNETPPTGFTAPRPVEIEVANIILNTVSPVLRTPLELIVVEQKAAIPVQDLPMTLPTRLYYAKNFDVSTGSGYLYIWGGALYAYQLEIFTWDQTVLSQFPDLTTAFIYPPGYQRMIRKCLAVEIAPLMTMYSKSARAESPMAPSQTMLQIVSKQADDARAMVESYNAPAPILTGDPAFLGNSARRGWNYLLGTNGRTGR
jgi:hypothetical protein